MYSQHGARIDAPAFGLCSCQHGHSPLGQGLADDLGGEFDLERHFDTCLSPLCTPAHIATCNGRGSTARLLLARGADVKACRSLYSRETTPILHTAARCNDATTIRFIIDQDIVDIDANNDHGETALHCAVLHTEDTSALLQLLSLGADRNAEGHCTAFEYACKMGNFKTALILLNSGMRNFGRARGFQPVHHASLSRHYFPRRYVDEDPEAWEQEREAFLHRFVTDDLARDGSGINDLDAWQRSPLLAAASFSPLPRTLGCLLDLGADINHMDQQGLTAIQHIIRQADYGNVAGISLLLQRGARLDLRSELRKFHAGEDGCCALDTALLKTNASMGHPVLMTIFRHASGTSFSEGFLSFFVTKLYLQGRYKDCALLINNWADWIQHGVKKECVLGSMKMAVDKRNFEDICFYLNHFPVLATTHDALCMVLKACSHTSQHDDDSRKRDSEFIDKLCKRPDFHISVQENYCVNLLHLACKNHHLGIVAQLLRLGSQANLLDEDHQTPLYYAVKNCCPHTVKLLLSHGADPFLSTAEVPRHVRWGPGRRWNTLNSIANYRCAFDHAILCNPKDVVGNVAATFCDHEPRNPNLVEIILKYCGPPPLPKDPKSLTYIHQALEHPKELKHMLEAGADPNAGDNRERSPLLFAMLDLTFSPVVLQSIGLLVKYGADVHGTCNGYGKSFFGIMQEADQAVATNTDQSREFAPGNRKFKEQCALARLFKFTVDPVSGDRRIDVRPMKEYNRACEEAVSKRNEFEKRVRENSDIEWEAEEMRQLRQRRAARSARRSKNRKEESLDFMDQIKFPEQASKRVLRLRDMLCLSKQPPHAEQYSAIEEQWWVFFLHV